MAYKYTDGLGDIIELSPSAVGGVDVISITSAPVAAVIQIPNEDVPTVAAELLKAAGHNYLAGYIEADIDCRERTKEAEAEKKLQERRDALAAEFAETWGLSTRAYMNCDGPLRTAITRIIELEDGK